MLWKYYTPPTRQQSPRSGNWKSETHIAPPRAGSPPECAEPRAARLLHLAERTLDGGDTLRVVARADLAKEALEAGLLEPLGRRLQTLCADSRGHAGGRGSRAIRVEVLVHLWRTY